MPSDFIHTGHISLMPEGPTRLCISVVLPPRITSQVLYYV